MPHHKVRPLKLYWLIIVTSADLYLDHNGTKKVKLEIVSW